MPSAAGPEREASREAIVDGFLVISGTGLAICALAALSAAMIRPKRAVAAAPAAPPVAAGASPEPVMADGGS